MPQYHPTEHPGLLQHETPQDLGARAELLADKHIRYLIGFGEKDERDWQVVASDSFRMSGVYWTLTALALLGRPVASVRDEAALAAWVHSCFKQDEGCFAPNAHHDGNLLSTLSALQVLALIGRLGEVDADKVASYCASLQLQDGSFMGDKWGEVDTRFAYVALHACALLGRLGALDVAAAVGYVIRCQNFDGAFGVAPGCESHTGQVFCCVGALAIAGQLHRIDGARLSRWLSERQTQSGGLQGRPEKLQDVCYSWWAVSSLEMLGRAHWIDRAALRRFILNAQDEHGGGIADRPDDMVDVFHTFFGVAALSLLGHPGLEAVHPVYALPVATVTALGLAL